MEQSPVPSSIWQRLADPEKKREFAKHLRTKPDTDLGRYEAALLTFPEEPTNSFLVYQIKEAWPYDIIVIAERDRLAKVEPANDMPTVEQTAREVYNLAIDNTKTVKERLDAYRLYGELMQMIGKANSLTVNTQINNDNRGVFVVPARSVDPIAFAEKAAAMQARLVNSAKPSTA